jgi:hypothetical protein
VSTLPINGFYRPWGHVRRSKGAAPRSNFARAAFFAFLSD